MTWELLNMDMTIFVREWWQLVLNLNHKWIRKVCVCLPIDLIWTINQFTHCIASNQLGRQDAKDNSTFTRWSLATCGGVSIWRLKADVAHLFRLPSSPRTKRRLNETKTRLVADQTWMSNDPINNRNFLPSVYSSRETIMFGLIMLFVFSQMRVTGRFPHGMLAPSPQRESESDSLESQNPDVVPHQQRRRLKYFLFIESIVVEIATICIVVMLALQWRQVDLIRDTQQSDLSCGTRTVWRVWKHKWNNFGWLYCTEKWIYFGESSLSRVRSEE